MKDLIIQVLKASFNLEILNDIEISNNQIKIKLANGKIAKINVA